MAAFSFPDVCWNRGDSTAGTIAGTSDGVAQGINCSEYLLAMTKRDDTEFFEIAFVEFTQHVRIDVIGMKRVYVLRHAQFAQPRLDIHDDIEPALQGSTLLSISSSLALA